MTRYNLGISTVKWSTFFPLWGTTSYLILGSECHPWLLFQTLYTLRSTAIKMAASSNNRKKDLLTEDDIYRVLDKEDESDAFSK